MVRNLALTLSLFGFSALSSSAQADTVRWDTGQAVLAGNGCVKDVDAFVLSNGNDLALVFSNLGVDLPARSGMPLSARRSCSARIPATISAGLYIGQLTQRASYGVTKTARSEGSLAIRSTFFNYNVSPYTVTVPRNAVINSPLLTSSRVDNFTINTPGWGGWCGRNRSPRGNYQANLAVSGQRDSDREDLIMFADGLDVKFEVIASLVHCGS